MNAGILARVVLLPSVKYLKSQLSEKQRPGDCQGRAGSLDRKIIFATHSLLARFSLRRRASCLRQLNTREINNRAPPHCPAPRDTPKRNGKEKAHLQKLIKASTKMNIKPLADRVLVKPAAAEEKTAGGIIIPDTAKEKPLQGEVLAVGQGTKDEEMVLKAGDQVLYGKYAGTEVELDGEKYIIMRQSDVLAVLG